MVVRKWWMIILGVWFLFYGAIAILSLHFDGLGLIMGILAIVGGILLWLDR